MNSSDAALLSLADLDLGLLRSAWERVRDNDGCAGVDGVTIEQFTHQTTGVLPELLCQIRGGQYLPLPLRRIDVEKRPGSRSYRTLMVPAIRDRIAQTAVGRLLARDWEQEFLTASYAYRPGRGLDAAIGRIVSLRDAGWTWVADADISDYFGSISHTRLERALAAQPIEQDVCRLIHLWIHGFSWDGRKVDPVRKGIAQGSPISPLLANFFLTPFDDELERLDARLIRYSDDFIILCKSGIGAWRVECGSELDGEEQLAVASR